jgi:hypothetical protein
VYVLCAHSAKYCDEVRFLSYGTGLVVLSNHMVAVLKMVVMALYSIYMDPIEPISARLQCFLKLTKLTISICLCKLLLNQFMQIPRWRSLQINKKQVDVLFLKNTVEASCDPP